MASNEGAQRTFHLSNLDDAETALLDLAADDGHVLSLSDKEALILRLYDQIQELELEQAVLEQGMQRRPLWHSKLMLVFRSGGAQR
jgi:hypothetical protein